MNPDIDAVLRRLKPEKRRKPLAARPAELLAWVEEAPVVGCPILLDTTVYVDVLYGRSPPELDEFISVRACNHSAVCMAEMMHLFGRLDPEDHRTPKVLRSIKEILRTVPSHRLHAPEEDIWTMAGVLGGLLFRLGSFPSGAERKCLNDALIYVQARKLGCPVVTSNRRDFDYLHQLVPDGRVLCYRKSN